MNNKIKYLSIGSLLLVLIGLMFIRRDKTPTVEFINTCEVLTQQAPELQLGYDWSDDNFRILIIRIKLQNTEYNPACTEEYFNEKIFGTHGEPNLSASINDASYGQFYLSGDVTPIITLPYDYIGDEPFNCGNENWTVNDTYALIESHGYDLQSYDLLASVASTGPGCSGNVAAGDVSIVHHSICGKVSDLFVKIFHHEMSHTFDPGLGHAATCNPEGCQTYGDWSSPLGSMPVSIWHGLNVPHKIRIGWLNENNILFVSQPGTYTIYTASLSPETVAGPQVLQIYNEMERTDYYVSYRTNHGYDQYLTDDYITFVHNYNYPFDNSQLWATLNDNDEYTLIGNQITITQLSHTDTSVTLSITGNIDFSIPEQSLRVFATEAVFTGDLGGLEGADAICQNAADHSTIIGDGTVWKAWLSTEEENASERIYQSHNQYVNVLGDIIADNWDDLVDCGDGWDDCLQNPININERGGNVSGINKVFTNTGMDGTLVADDRDCNNWTDSTSSFTAFRGDINSSDYRWTRNTFDGCDKAVHLYCFEQPGNYFYLSLLLAQWGQCSGCESDFNSDGVVDAVDLAILLSRWGE